MPRQEGTDGKAQSRRADILDAAHALFIDRGYDGTPVSAIAERAGVSKAAVTFHFPAKEQLLEELAGPFLERLEGVVAAHPSPQWPAGVWDLAGAIFDVCVDHLEVARWIETDRAMQTRQEYGGRLNAVNEYLVGAMVGEEPAATDRMRALAALGGLWRPLRTLTASAAELRAHRDELLHAALVSYAPFEPSTE